MDVVTLTGATIFKFHRSEKKWKEKGHGNVTFLLKGAVLLVGVGKQSFFVKGSLRPKGPNAIVMRVWGTDNSDMILAVRFGKEGDSKRLTKLSDKMSEKQKEKTPTSRKTGKSHPPLWFSAFEKSKRKGIQSLIRYAKNLKHGVIHMQLEKMYELSPSQIEQLFDFFHPWRDMSNIQNTNNIEGNEVGSTIALEDPNLLLSPLTEQNLILYNTVKPPLKGDFRTIVRTWLDKSLP